MLFSKVLLMPLVHPLHLIPLYSKYLNGTIVEKTEPKTEKDAILNAEVKYFTDSTLWQQKVKVNANDSVLLKGTISYMYKEGDEYKPGEEKFKFFIQPAPAVNSVSVFR